MNRSNRDRERSRDRDYDDRSDEFGFRQTHGGRQGFQDSEWGRNSEFRKNKNFRESDSYDRRQRPYDMDNYYSGRQFSVGGVDFDQDERDDEFSSREFNRSRFADPYSGQQSDIGRLGQRQENYSGKGPKGYKRSDERIREEACEALYRSPYVDATDIDVTVKDGIVTLKGAVESRNAKREAESCIENLSGVEDVQNELSLKKSEGNFISDTSSDQAEQNKLTGQQPH